jgi:transcriptional regulator with XRE-family HTH domain
MGSFIYTQFGGKTMAKKLDAFEKWKASTGINSWPKVRELLTDLSKKGYTQRQICERLKLSEAYFSRLKKKHPEIEQAFIDADDYVLDAAFTALYKVAFGSTYVTEDTWLEDKQDGSKPRKKVHRVKRETEPNLGALVYLLTQRFGRQYSDKREELELARQKMENNKEEWSNGTNDNDGENK